MRLQILTALVFAASVACGSSEPASVPPAGYIPAAPPPHRRGPPHPPMPPHERVTPPIAPTASTPPHPPGPPVEHVRIEVTPAVHAIVDAKDRSPDDKKLDAGRHPAELLAFLGVGPGMKVAELGAAGGYTTELLARAVGPNGKVYGENSKFIIDMFAKAPWAARLAKPVNRNVVRADREFDDPLPPDAKDLDVVLINLFYHDTVWMGTDRDKMNRAVFAALKPGGAYVIIDHSGRPGTGTTESKTIHRIEESAVRDEVEKAGFRLAADADFLRNPQDARDWNTSPRAAAEKRGTSDRFALKFVKP